MKGIILAGGNGTRLYPITKGICKQLLPVYDKPMIYYPLSVLMLAGIKDILIIHNPQDRSKFESLFGNGSDFGINLSYEVQQNPEGIAQALIIAKDFIQDDSVCLILGDNIFYGTGFSAILKKASKLNDGAIIFAYPVNDPWRFGIANLDKQGKVIKLEEKPKNTKSNLAVTGLYFYDKNAVKFAQTLKPSERLELEITDLNKIYLQNDNLSSEVLGRGFAWLDCGTYDSLNEASIFVQTMEKRTGFKIACLEEIAYNNKWIDEDKIINLAKKYKNNSYGEYLMQLI